MVVHNFSNLQYRLKTEKHKNRPTLIHMWKHKNGHAGFRGEFLHPKTRRVKMADHNFVIASFFFNYAKVINFQLS